MRIKRRSGGSFITKESFFIKKTNENKQPSHLSAHCCLPRMFVVLGVIFARLRGACLGQSQYAEVGIWKEE